MAIILLESKVTKEVHGLHPTFEASIVFVFNLNLI
jgi:hypothetical protein